MVKERTKKKRPIDKQPDNRLGATVTSTYWMGDIPVRAADEKSARAAAAHIARHTKSLNVTAVMLNGNNSTVHWVGKSPPSNH